MKIKLRVRDDEKVKLKVKEKLEIGSLEGGVVENLTTVLNQQDQLLEELTEILELQSGNQVEIKLQEKTVDPTTERQEITADVGSTGLSKVIVTAIQTESATLSSNGKYTPTDGKYFSEVTVDVNTTPKLQEKSVTPSKLQQEIEADKGYDGLSQVIVERIPEEYIIPNGEKSITENGNYNVAEFASVDVKVDIPEGYIKPSGSLEIDENGEYDVTEKSSVIVSVSSSGGGDTEEVARNFIERNFPNGFTFPSGLTKIGDYAFYFAKFLDEVVLDDTVTTIGSSAFYQSSTTKITAPNVTSFGQSAFSTCLSLVYASLDSVVTMGGNTFQMCRALETVNLPNVKTLGSYEFSTCSNIKIVDLPKCTSIGAASFQSTKKLEALILRANSVCVLQATNVFSSSTIASGTGYIYVPNALKEQYKGATNWSSFANQFRSIEDYPEITEV
jgi:hypothetical protein